MFWIRQSGRSVWKAMLTPWNAASALLLLGLAALPVQAQVDLDPGATGKISFATEAITGQSSGASTATFGTVDGYTNQLISAGHGLANLGAPTAFGSASGSITNQSLSSGVSGPAPFGNGQITFSAGDTGMGYGVLWSSYSLGGAPGAAGLVSLTRANGVAAFTNSGSDPLDIETGVLFGLQGNVTANDIAGGALATTITVGSSTFTPYVSIAFDGSSSTGFVEPGFIGAVEPDAVQSTAFQQGSGMFDDEGSILYDVVLLPGQTLTLDTTLTLFASGSASLTLTHPVGWPNGPHNSTSFATVEITSASPVKCPMPEPGGPTLGAALAVLLACLVRKRVSTARRRSNFARSLLPR